jgi:hypothetical protein
MIQDAYETLDAGLWMQDEVKNLLFIQVPAFTNQFYFASANPISIPSLKR